MDGVASTPDKARVLVIVPAYNESSNIEAVLDDLGRHAPWADVVVVDDASTDGTAGLAAARGARVLALPCNLGVGGAVQTGYQFASERGYDLTVQFDGDAQHRANQIGLLVEAARSEGADLVIGSRVLNGVRFRFHPLRRMGSRLLRWLISRIAGQTITDPTSGFRVASRRAIRFFASHYPQTYLGDTAESLVWVLRQKMIVAEVPVRMRRRTGGESTTGSIQGVWHLGRIILAVLVDCLEPVYEEEGDGAP